MAVVVFVELLWAVVLLVVLVVVAVSVVLVVMLSGDVCWEVRGIERVSVYALGASGSGGGTRLGSVGPLEFGE